MSGRPFQCKAGVGYATYQGSRKMADGRPRYMLETDQCQRRALPGEDYCWSHKGAKMVPVVKQGEQA